MSTGTGRVAPLTDEDLASLGAWLSEPQSGTLDAARRILAQGPPKPSGLKRRLMDWNEKTIRADFAEEVAREIETSLGRCPREHCDVAYCLTCRANAYALGLAAMVRRKGGVE